MEFCARCGGVLVPQKVGRARMLVCQHCGQKTKPKRRSVYKIVEKGKEREEVVVIVEKKRKQRRPIEREYEFESPEYYEEFFEES